MTVLNLLSQFLGLEFATQYGVIGLVMALFAGGFLGLLPEVYRDPVIRIMVMCLMIITAVATLVFPIVAVSNAAFDTILIEGAMYLGMIALHFAACVLSRLIILRGPKPHPVVTPAA